MSVCTVSGTILDPSGNPISGVSINFSTQSPILAAEPVQGSTSTAANGTWSLSLQQSISGIFTINVPSTSISKTVPYKFNCNIPATSTATFASTIVDNS